MSSLTVIVVSYNTRALTKRALETLYATTRSPMRVIVVDNASTDGSANAIAEAFPDADLVRSEENLGFARANNLATKMADTEWLLLLNPDTEVHEGAVHALLSFAEANPRHGIYGGRTVFPDGSLNPGSCWMQMTPWSLFCSAAGLTFLFPNSALFNPEAMGGWMRDTEREVDIVQGSFFLIRRALWEELGGFDTRYFMYGEEADLCLRAKALGYSPIFTPAAEIMHLAGAASPTAGHKKALLYKGKATLVRDHWSSGRAKFGLLTMKMGVGLRLIAARLLDAFSGGRFRASREAWEKVWGERDDWLAGY